MIPRSVPETENRAGVALGLLGPVTQSTNAVGGAAVVAAATGEASVAADALLLAVVMADGPLEVAAGHCEKNPRER